MGTRGTWVQEIALSPPWCPRHAPLHPAVELEPHGRLGRRHHSSGRLVPNAQQQWVSHALESGEGHEVDDGGEGATAGASTPHGEEALHRPHALANGPRVLRHHEGANVRGHRVEATPAQRGQKKKKKKKKKYK